MKELIRFEHLTKEYKTEEQSFYALNDVSCSIDKNELVIILEPSRA
jgi:ABC-type lipoprotein export system ATPase subunit